jgi:DNA primase
LQNYFHNTLLNSEEGKRLAILISKTFTNDTIKRIWIGFSPEAWDAFTKRALGKGYKLNSGEYRTHNSQRRQTF